MRLAVLLTPPIATRWRSQLFAATIFTTVSVVNARRSHLRHHRAMESAAERFQRHLDSVTVQSAPRIELTSGRNAGDLASLAVLDSSFNPPTRAHLHVLAAAMKQLGLTHSLLLLAKQNADKQIVGANLVQRLEMMDRIAAAAEPAGTVLCGVTAHPLFVDKAVALRALCERPDARVVVLVGFDTWVRIIDPKYYAAGGLDAALRQIFDAVEVIVASREQTSTSDSIAPLSAQEQEKVVRELPDHVTRNRLHFLYNEPEMAPLSSSALRQAIAEGSRDTVRSMLPDCLRSYVDDAGLYLV